MLRSLRLTQPATELLEVGTKPFAFLQDRCYRGPLAFQVGAHREQLGAPPRRCLLRGEAATLLTSKPGLSIGDLLPRRIDNRLLPTVRPGQPQHPDLVDQLS